MPALRLLALGDSYTIGEGVAPGERWPSQLAGLLRREGFDVAAPAFLARTGWTTSELAAAIAARPPRGPFALVTLLAGVNNQYRGLALDAYRDEFRSLLGTAAALAGGHPARVIVLSIPDWGVTPFAEGRDRARVAREIDAFNAANRGAAERAGAGYVDVTALSRAYGGLGEYLSDDGLHPSAAMYALWAEAALPAVRAALGKPGGMPAN